MVKGPVIALCAVLALFVGGAASYAYLASQETPASAFFSRLSANAPHSMPGVLVSVNETARLFAFETPSAYGSATTTRTFSFDEKTVLLQDGAAATPLLPNHVEKLKALVGKKLFVFFTVDTDGTLHANGMREPRYTN